MLATVNIPQQVSVTNSLYYNLQAAEENKPRRRFSATKTQLDRQLMLLYLYNPYWTDFRILNHFHKRKIQITLGELQQLKQHCGLENREQICHALIRLAIDGGIQLNKRQIRFIEKVKPEFRDRDILPTKPGELLVYECICGRGIGDIGRVYIHLFVDMFTGYTFCQLGRRRTVEVALQVVQETVVPSYRLYNQVIQTIMHSTRIMSDTKELNGLEAKGTLSQIGLQWIPTHRKFGIIEKFEQRVLAEFFERLGTETESFTALQVSFAQWYKKYESGNHFLSRRELLQL